MGLIPAPIPPWNDVRHSVHKLGAHHIHQTSHCINLWTFGCLYFRDGGTNHSRTNGKKCSGQLKERVHRSFQQALSHIPTPKVSLNPNIFGKVQASSREVFRDNVQLVEMRSPNPKSRDNTTKSRLRLPNVNSRGHVTKRGL